MKTKTSNAQSAYSVILKKIMNQELKPGENITEVSLSQKLGISRTPVRDAIQRLEIEGLIVTENRTKKVYYLTPRDIENIFDLKIAIESIMAHLAAQKGSDEQMDHLSNIVLQIRELINDLKSGNEDEETFFEKWINTDQLFHTKIAEMADNSRAEQIINTLNTQWHRIKMGLSAIEGRMEKSAAEHEMIGKAIISRDPVAAEQAVKAHLSNLKNVLLKIMQAFSF
ncbi:MAG TPA: GntR family transcriptional regulator [Draconibacterium sp.]|nr:GntR family transcriptional regulator [Draconibacterium sp.]